jgi:hypothetical protein
MVNIRSWPTLTIVSSNDGRNSNHRLGQGLSWSHHFNYHHGHGSSTSASTPSSSTPCHCSYHSLWFASLIYLCIIISKLYKLQRLKRLTWPYHGTATVSALSSPVSWTITEFFIALMSSIIEDGLLLAYFILFTCHGRWYLSFQQQPGYHQHHHHQQQQQYHSPSLPIRRLANDSHASSHVASVGYTPWFSCRIQLFIIHFASFWLLAYGGNYKTLQPHLLFFVCISC